MRPEPSTPDPRLRGPFVLGDHPEQDAAVSAHLGAIRKTVRDATGALLRGLVLVGSYARGEGAMRTSPRGFVPVNDYDLVAVVPLGARLARPTFARLSAELTGALGVHVDVWPVALGTLTHAPQTLFWYDVACGSGRVLHGPAGLLAPLARVRDLGVPWEEAQRLLTNRAVGLALSRLLPAHQSPLARQRHGHKAALACGDARLLGAGCYAPRMTARAAKLAALQGCPGVPTALVQAYEDALRWQGAPEAWTPRGGSVTAWFEAVCERVGGWHEALEAAPGRATGEPYDLHPAWRLAAPFAALAGPRACPPRERLRHAARLLAYHTETPDARAEAARWLGLPREQTHDRAALGTALEQLASRGG